MTDQPAPPPEWASRLPPHDHPVIRSYVGSHLRLLQHYVGLTPQTKLLEVGCGNGYFTVPLAGLCDVFGIDINPVMLGLNPVKQTARMDAARMEFADASFDVVLCHETLHHADDPAAIVREMARVSRRHVVLVEPNRNNPLMFLMGLLIPAERGALAYTPRSLSRMAEAAGLAVRERFAYGLLPIAAPACLLPLGERTTFRTPVGWDSFVFAEKSL